MLSGNSSRVKWLLLAPLVLLLVGVPASAKASSIVYAGSPLVAQAINNLGVGGVNYDVTFADGTLDSTFYGNLPGATAAAQAIANALNSGTAAYVTGPGFSSVNNFTVLTDSSYGGITMSSYFQPQQWQAVGGYYGVTTQFTQVTPEPASVLLFGTGALLLVGAAAYERKRARILA